jgi:hypothetical protein
MDCSTGHNRLCTTCKLHVRAHRRSGLTQTSTCSSWGVFLIMLGSHRSAASSSSSVSDADMSLTVSHLGTCSSGVTYRKAVVGILSAQLYLVDDEKSAVACKQRHGSDAKRTRAGGGRPMRDSAAAVSPDDEAELMTLCTAITAMAAAVWLMTGFLSLWRGSRRESAAAARQTKATNHNC